MPSSTSILIHNNKILLILRDNKPDIPEPNTWQLPGGGVEEGEDHFEAIQRELKEEIGIIPDALKCLGEVGKTKVFLSFLTNDEVSRIRLGDEGARVDFFELEKALELNLTRKLRMYIENYKEGVKKLIEKGFVDSPTEIGLL